MARVYSGYVHGAAPHTMDMCGGRELRFHLAGLTGTPRVSEHIQDFWNYVYRGFLACILVARVFGDGKTEAYLSEKLAAFEAASGSTYVADSKREHEQRAGAPTPPAGAAP